MLSASARSKCLLGAKMLKSKLMFTRSIASLPRRQAQVTDVGKTLNTDSVALPSLFNTVPGVPGQASDAVHACGVLTRTLELKSSARASRMNPTTAAVLRDRDDFWRRVPIWQNVSAEDFLSYRWSVSSSYHRPLVSRVERGVTLTFS